MDFGNIKGIKYTAPVFDGSGYARAARDYILALHNKGVPITISPVSFESHRPNLGENGSILQSLVNKDIEYNVHIIHLTPEHIPIYKEEGMFTINLTVWETDKIHDDWVEYCNQADALIVPCKWNVDVFKNSGVNKKFGVVPHGIDMEPFDSTKDKLKIKNVKETDYVFYSVFQWTERKNPYGLLRAYYSAFAGVEDVVLVLKTYGSNFSDAESERIVTNIMSIKNNIKLPEGKAYPKVALIFESMSEEDMIKLHNTGDCYISLAHSEGWGLGYFHAMAAGKPTIGTGGSGNEDFMNQDNSFLIPYTWSPTIGMPNFVWYTNDQFWPEPDLKEAVNVMREVYENRQAVKNVGRKAKQDISLNFNWDRVSNIMVEEINKLLEN